MALPTPEGKQKEVLCLPELGHFVVLGTAGSGKTTLAIHRSAYLAKLTDSDKKVLLVTFNKSLVTYLKSISDGTLSNIDVHNYHRFARGYLSSVGMLGYRGDIVNTMGRKKRIIEQAIETAIEEIGENSTLSRAPEVFYEEICWMQKMGIATLENYINAERIGRAGTRVTRAQRKYFFYVYEKYLEIRQESGYKYDWDDISQTVKEEMQEDDNERMYQHIVIDEGQDLSPVMLQSLALAVPENGSITFFGDVAQQIYGGRISWRNAGLKVKKNEIWRFDQNYRNSKEIADLAIAISELPFFKQDADLVAPIQPTASGPKPVLVEFQNEQQELDWIIRNAIALAENETVAILTRIREDVNIILNILQRQRIRTQKLHGDMNGWDINPGVSVGTYHSAKGLEFDSVMVPYCNADRIPSPDKIAALEDRDEALSEEVKLIYVAVTRARRRLVITYTGKPTELIPQDDMLFDKQKAE
ncbi:MAG: 3'-5' exonuclease [Desulfitobacteriaceae bacterium]|nr:3'-5' exonuclease [Desulfitobacteriaceae bacterium]